MNSITNNLEQETIQQWIAAKLDPEAVEKELLSKGFDPETVSTHLKEYKRLRIAKKQFAGFIYMGLGAFMGFLSCVLSIVNPVPQLYQVFLFGLTSLAILLICYGLYLVFE
jgi:hypothetical protein